MDALTIQWGWFGGNSVSGPTPPAPPAPDDGDAAALIGFGHMLPAGEARRFYWREKVDPWEQIRAWARRLVRLDTPEWHVNPELLKAKQERDVHIVTRITRMARRRP